MIPYTLHWDKIYFILDNNRVRQMYGDKAVGNWNESRNNILGHSALEIFSNDFIQKCGLDKTIGPIV